MTAHLPDSIAADFLQAWRKKRLRSTIIWSPVIFLIVWACLVGLLLWRGHGLVHLLGEFFETERVLFLILFVPVPFALVGAVLCCLLMIRDCRSVSVPFCVDCRRAQHSLGETCERCGKALVQKRSYVYVSYDDEKQIAAFYGLQNEDA